MCRDLKRASEELEGALNKLPPWTHGVESVRQRCVLPETLLSYAF